jgi:subtilase family serine protease
VSVAALAGLTLVAAGCGSSSGAKVGQVGTSSGSNGSGSSSASGSGDPTPYSACMRGHGVPHFPDPPRIGARKPKLSPQELGVSESEFQAAASACNHLLPNGRRPTQVVASTAGASPVTATGDCDSLATCYTPRQLEAAYGILPLLEHGTDGRGETVVLPELAEPQFPLPTSDIRRDLAQFDKLFHLPAARLRVVKTLAPSASPWLANGEEVLDTEMVHAIAPRAAIVELLVKGTSLSNIANGVAASVAALRLGTSLGGVISISAAGQTGGEHCDNHADVAALHAALRNAANHHVTVVAASGDIGAVGEPCQLIKGLVGGTFPPVKEANLPASDPLVLGAGGTTLTASHKTGAYISERAWGLPFGGPGSHFQASGGGLSRLFARPRYQSHIAGLGAYRGVPDVAATASAHTALAVITSTRSGTYTVHGSGGTSAGAPLWAGLIALADQDAGRHLGFVNAALYRIGRSARYHHAFHDVTTGSNTVRFPPRTISGYHATPRWDPVTGWGSPKASVLIPMLARYVHPDDGKGL